MPFFERDGLALHYSVVGSGPAVLLIHGWGGRGRRQWHATMLELRDRYRFIALDLRGHGRSEEVKQPNYGWHELVADCEALCALLAIDRWPVVTYSLAALSPHPPARPASVRDPRPHPPTHVSHLHSLHPSWPTSTLSPALSGLATA